jgi:Tfp pilus assembly protein PilN
MERINLLPRDLRERRKYERFYPLIGLGAAIVFGVIALAYVGLMVQVNAKNHDLQEAKQQVEQLNAQAQAFSVFEEKEEELQQRKEVAAVALGNRVNWSKVSYEVSLVMPAEVWVTGIQATQDTEGGPYDPESGQLNAMDATYAIIGYTPDASPDAFDESYKSLARTMVRLNELEVLRNVWLEEAAIQSYPPNAQAPNVPVDVQGYTITSNVALADPSPEDAAPGSDAGAQ